MENVNGYMETYIIIIEKEEPVPENIRTWAKQHLVAVVPERNCGEAALLDAYDYVIEYSKDVSLKYLEIAYCHTHNLPAIIAETESLIIKEIGMEETEEYRKIIENVPNAVSDKTLLGLSSEEFARRHRAYMMYSYGLLGYGIYGVYLKNPVKGTTCATGNDGCEKMIGIAGLDGTEVPLLSYAVLKEYQGMGYAFSACCSIMDYFFTETEMDKVNISVAKDNGPSINLARKLADRYAGKIMLTLV